MSSQPYDQVIVGDRFGEATSVLDWHLITAAALYNDMGPNHVNPKHSSSNRFGAPIAPGFLTTGLMMGVVGRQYGWSIEAFLETQIRFLAPVYAGDTIHVLWEVREVQPKVAFGGGIITLKGWCWAGESDRLSVDMDAKIALNNSEGPPLHAPPDSLE